MTRFIVDYDRRASVPSSVKAFERVANKERRGHYRLDRMWFLKISVRVLGLVALTRDRDDLAVVTTELFHYLPMLELFPDMAEPIAEDILEEVKRISTFLPDHIVLDSDKPRSCEIEDHRHGALLICIR